MIEIIKKTVSADDELKSKYKSNSIKRPELKKYIQRALTQESHTIEDIGIQTHGSSSTTEYAQSHGTAFVTLPSGETPVDYRVRVYNSDFTSVEVTVEEKETAY